MPIFKYKALNEYRQPQRGLVEAATVEAVAELLIERKLTIISIDEGRQSTISLASLPFFGKAKNKNVVIFSRQLAVMMAATVPIVQALRILIVQTDDRVLKQIISSMANDIDGGMKLSSAFAKHPETFSNFYVAMLRSGETSGRLEKVLNYLATQMEKDYDLVSRIRGAMIYPAFIITALVGVGAAMLIFVVPKMTDLLKANGAELPFMTRMLIGVSDFLTGYWWALILAAVIVVVGTRFLLNTSWGREAWDNGKLHIPVFGSLFKKIILSRFATGLSTLIKGGVPISRALKITSDVVSNKAFKVLIEATVKEVEDGNSITTIFAQNKMVPAIVSQMMGVGERTGRMDEVLDRLGDFYGREVDTMIGSLTSLIEPIIMIILGVAVGLMVSAIILPIFQVANSIN